MHPHPDFRWQDSNAMRAFVRERAFGALFVSTPSGPAVVHLPVVFEGEETLALHLSRSNRIAAGLGGASALFVVQGPDAYVSPDWYDEGPDHVPTWNYVAVEIEGTLEQVSRDALIAQIDLLGHEQEARLAPKPEWRRDKVDPAAIDHMLNAIAGFRLHIAEWRGTVKMGQTESAAARHAAADALTQRGKAEIARWMRSVG